MALHATRADLARLHADLQAHKRAVKRQDVRAHVEHDLAFHSTLRHAAGNAELIAALDRVEGQVTIAMLSADHTSWPAKATLADSGAASVSNLFKEIAPKIVARDWSPAFTVDLLAKDNRLGVTMIEEVGLTPRVARAVVIVNDAGQARGLGELDTSALSQLVQDGAA